MKKKLLASLTLTAAAVLGWPLSAQAAATSQVIPFDADVQACNGDTVHLSGSLQDVFQLTTTPSGGFMLGTHDNAKGISGVDLVTGTVFHATGLTREHFSFGPSGGFTDTYVNRFHIQATGGAESFIVSETSHITVTPDGKVTAYVDNFSSTCG
jgi:hypothetical protein